MEEVQFYLGIDWGKSKIGLALADSVNNIATPYKIVKNIDEVIKIIKQENIDLIVLGKPLKMSGSDLKMTQGFGSFVAKLGQAVNRPIELIDERLTTKQADKLLLGNKGGRHEDAVVAMIILQSYLDKLILNA